jgi:hypothetical protein
MKDLTDPRWITFKGILFVIVGAIAAALLWLEVPTLKGAVLLAVAVWCFCRAYYFAFYVIEKYIDPGFRFSGLWSAVRFVCSRRGGSKAEKS